MTLAKREAYFSDTNFFYDEKGIFYFCFCGNMFNR